MSHSVLILKFLLRLAGAVMLLAVGAVLMPRSWMAAAHQWLKLGPFPDGPIVVYLARSVSAFYAATGGLLLLVSRDLRRYAPVVAYFALAGILFGIAICTIDFMIGLPAWWTVGEGLSLFPLCIIVLALQWRIRRARRAS